MQNDLMAIKTHLNVSENIKIPHINPCKVTKQYENYFILDLDNPIHDEMVKYLKERLKPDIDKYNTICQLKGLNHLIIC